MTIQKLLFSFLMLFLSIGSFSQTTTVKGTVIDESGNPLQNATIAAENNAAIKTLTNVEGKFSLNVPAGTKAIVVSFVGYESTKFNVSSAALKVVLKLSTVSLNDVVVTTGYGTNTKRNITGAITTINADNFNRGAFSSPSQLLQGKVSGLNIAKSGDPNINPTVILRGPSTLREGAQEPFYVIDGVPGASLELVAPADIISIDVLKDASSTAIYGARAANGVIMVNTRRGSAGQTHLSYDTYVSVDKVSRKIDMLNGIELREYLAKNGQSLTGSIYDDPGASTDWQKEIMRDGISTNHNIAISGGNKSTIYSGSFNYFKNDGIVKTTSLDRSIIKASVEQKFFDDRFKVGVNMTNSITNKYDVFQSFLFNNMLFYMPTVNVRRPNGTLTEDFTRGGYANPVGLIETNKNYTKENSSLIQGYLEANILKGLTYTARYSIQNKQRTQGIYLNSNSALALQTGGRAYRGTYSSDNKVLESFLNYDKKIGSHNFKLLLGYSWQQDHFNDGFGVQTQGFTNDNLSYNNLFLSNPGTVGNIVFDNPAISTLRLISNYGRLNYSYKSKYLFQASMRNDGSSAFGANNRWGYFPAVSAGWRLSGESFLQNAKWLDDLKFRVGYGVSGNSLGFDAFTSIFRYGAVGRYYSNGQLLTAIGPSQNDNKDLKWESTSVLNVGFDFSLFSGKITGNLDWYNKQTSDLIWDQYPVSTTQYFVSTITANVGKMKNTGVELTLNSTLVSKSKFSWNSSVNLSTNKNTVMSLSNDKFKLNQIPTAYLGGKGQTGNWSQVVKEGQPLGTFALWKYMGKNAAGTSTFKKADGTIIATQPLTSDFMVAGNAQPKLIYGWNNTFAYSNFDLTVFFRGVYGNKILNNTLAALNNPADSKFNNIPRFTSKEAFTDNVAYLTSDRFLENGSYLRVDNLTLGYNFLNINQNIKKIRLYSTITNVLTLTKYTGIDPELNIGGLTPGIDNRNYYPKTRTFLLGLSLNF